MRMSPATLRGSVLFLVVALAANADASCTIGVADGGL